MNIHEASVQSIDADAQRWAHACFAFEHSALVTDAPWARTHRLAGAQGAAFLKIVPPHKRPVLPAIAALARQFAPRIPEVLAVNPQHGWLLSASHDGATLSYDSASEDLRELAQAFARMQLQAAASPEVLAGLPRPDLAALPARLLAFLRPGPGTAPSDASGVHAEYFIGAGPAQQYERALRRRMSLLEPFLARAAELPLTLEHGDLRPPNAAMLIDGTCVLLDWDDAMVGPAGMSLHGLFSGCAMPTILLSGSPAAQAAAGSPDGLMLHGYIAALAQGGYADVATLRRLLPAAMCAGMIQFIVNFAHYPGDHARADVRGTLLARLESLLDVCDLLTVRHASLTRELAADYEAHHEYRRAQHLLMDDAARHPHDAAVAQRLALVLHKRGDLESAAEMYERALELQPDSATLHAGLGAVLMEDLQLAPSTEHLMRALALAPGLGPAQTNLARARAIEQMQGDAAQPERMPILRYTDADRASAEVAPELLALGASLFQTYGTLQVDNAFAPEAIERIQQTFFEHYLPYFREDNHPDALRLGDKRYMLTVDIDETFGDPGLLGAPMVLPIIRKILGDDCVLGAFTAVISLPGSRDQRLHKDHPALFPETQWHFGLPCFATQIIIPLVPLNEFTGTTRFYKGSHLLPTEQAEAGGSQDPVVPLGSCLLTDYRCAHRGLGNRSDTVRPILTLIFNRPWFRDFKNYAQQPPLRITEAAYERMPEDLRALVSWWREESQYGQLGRSLLL